MPDLPEFCLAVVLGAMPPGLFAPQEVARDGEDAAERLARRRLAAVTSGSSRAERGAWVTLARSHHAPPIAILPPIPDLRPRLLRHAAAERDRLCARLPRDGFAAVIDLAPGQDLDRIPLLCDRRELPGTFDVIGDVHGHADALDALLARLGWRNRRPPPGRRAVFVGDLVDRGPDSPGVLDRVMDMVARGDALGSGLDQHHHMMVAARWTADRKVSARRSYRVAMRRQSLRRPMARSTVLRAR